MKLRSTLLLALTISTAPVTPMSANMVLTTAMPSTFSTSLFKMNPTTKNVLTGVGIGLGAIALGYFLYWCFRPLTDQELANKVRQELDSIGAQTLALPEESINLGLPKEIALMSNEQKDFLANEQLMAQLTTFGRDTELTRSQNWRATDENHLSQWCAQRAPILRTKAIINDNLELLNKRQRELGQRSLKSSTGPCNDIKLSSQIEALKTKLYRISRVFSCGTTTTYNTEVTKYNKAFDKKRLEERKLRDQELRTAVDIDQDYQLRRIADALQKQT